MPKFRRRPLEVEAVQFRKDVPAEDWPEGMEADVINGMPFFGAQGGFIIVNDGDWIVTDNFGRKHLYDPEGFAAQFEKIPQ